MADYAGRSKLWTPRWYPLKPVPIQVALDATPARFAVVPAGRRSGKTERAKRKGIKVAYKLPPGGRVGFGAPTRDQAKSIFWDDLKKMVPAWAMAGPPRETDLIITLRNGVEIRVVGMDKPARVEGTPWDWFCLDEYANCKEEAWMAHLYPALSTIGREGRAWLIGVPEGRNHYYELYKRAQADTSGQWSAFTWLSSEVLPERTIEAARRDMDPLTFQQEYEASFVNFSGQAYYPFRDDLHCAPIREKYNPRAPLIFMFDFNVEPGVAAIGQEIEIPDKRAPEPDIEFEGKKLFNPKVHPTDRGPVGATGVMGEVWIERNSNTEVVCNRLINDWGDHEGPIMLYGDATGGARGTAKLDGSDWDIITRMMYAHYGTERVHRKGHRATTGGYLNPSERARVNAVNTRLLTGEGVVRLVVDPRFAPHVVRDFEGVRLLEGGSGEIDKKDGEASGLTHISDAVGYYVEHRYPTRVGQRSRIIEGAF